MKKSKRIIGLLLAVMMVLSVFQTGIISFASDNTTNGLTPSQTKRTLDPGVTISATQVTRVAASSASPQAIGNTIVAATPSGIPLDEGSYAQRALAGETVSMPQIVLQYTNALDTVPQIRCTAGGTGIVLSSGEHDRNAKTYTWQIAGGAANPGENIEFTITYDFEGRRYTSKAYSFVEGVLQPAGAFVQTKNKDRKNWLHDYRHVGVSAAIRVLGIGVYSSLQTYPIQDGHLRGYFRAASNSFVENANAGYSTYGYVRTGDGQSTFNINSYKSFADIYIDESVTSKLEDINLRMTIDMPAISASNGNQTLTAVAATEGNQNATSNSASNMNGVLGFNSPASTNMYANSSSIRLNFSGINYKYSNMYTVVSKFASMASNGSDNWYNFTNIPVVLRFHYVNKGELRSLINDMLYNRDPETTGTSNLNKGINPQSWYYSGGWTGFTSALSNAYKALNNPRATQADLNGAVAELNYAYGNLVLRSAEYNELYSAYSRAETELEKTNWYTADTYAALQESLLPIDYDLNILYQAQVDEWTNAIDTAISNLVVQRADYTALDAAIAYAEELRENIGYYTDFSAVASAVALANANLNLTKVDQNIVDGYTLAINEAIAGLVYKVADYSAVNLAVSTAKSLTATNYVSFNDVRTAVNRVKYNYPITRQAEVDQFATDVNDALNALVPKPANYTALIELRNLAMSLNPEFYPAENFQPVINALRASDDYETVNIINQQKITTYTTNLQTAINNLVMYDADYTAVDAKILETEEMELTSLYTQESILALNTAKESVVRGLKIDQQATVDQFAENISNAINNLNFLLADYKLVDEAMTRANAAFEMQEKNPGYYDDMSKLIAAVSDVDYTLGINRQAEVNEMAQRINDAVDQLEPGLADYTEINEVVARFEAFGPDVSVYYDNYYVEIVRGLISGINYNLSRVYEADILRLAINIGKAITEMEKHENNAEYKYINEAISKVPENMSDKYTAASVKIVKDITAEITNRKILELKAKDQLTVDQYTAALNSALSSLVPLVGNYADVDNAIAEGYAIINANNPEISTKSVGDFNAYVNLINTQYRSYTVFETDKIAELAANVRAMYNSFTYAEYYNNADISLNVSNTILCPGQTVTVSVVLSTDYFAASTAIPVLYDSTYYELTPGTQPTFSGSFAQGSITSAILNSPVKGYPASYTTEMKAKWKYVYFTMMPDSNKSGNAVKLDPGQTVVTFSLTVKNVDIALGEYQTGKIWIDPDFIKTEDNMGGKLFVGRFPSSVVGVDVFSYGQTIDLANANTDLTLVNENSPADFSALEVAIAATPDYQQSFYTEDSYQAYINALAGAQAIIEIRDTITIYDQTTIDAATQALVEARNSLVLKDATTEPLEQALLLVPELSAELYTNETYQAYATAMNIGQAILNETNLTIVDDERINIAAQEIVDTFNALTIKDFSYHSMAQTALSQQINPELEYVQDTVDAFNEAYANLEAFMQQALNITNDAEGYALITALNDAFLDLKLMGANTANLENAIALLENLEYPQNYYTESSYNLLAQKVADGQVILAREDLTYLDQAEIDAATLAINNAFTALRFNDCSYILELFALFDIAPTYDADKYIESYYNDYLAKFDELNDILNTELTMVHDQMVLDFIDAFNATYTALETDGLIEADYTAVDDAIATADALNPTYYVNWDLVDTAINAVTRGLKFTRQEDVDAMALAINDAIELLVFKDPDFTNLQNAIDTELDYEEAFYTEDTYQAYVNALLEATSINDDREAYTIEDQVAIDNATQMLLDAIDLLKLKDATTQPLVDAIDNAMALDSSLYTITSYQALLAKVSAGYDLLAEENLTIVDNDRINALAQEIDDATVALVYKPFSYENEAQEALAKLIDPELEYDEAALLAFNTAYDNLATFMAGDINITNDAEGLALINAVNTTYDALALKGANTSELEDAVALVPEYPNDFYTEDTLSAFAGAVAAGNLLLERTDLTYQNQQEIDDAAQAIIDAFNLLTLKNADVTALEVAVAIVPEYEDDFYTEETITAFNDAVAAGNAILAEALTIVEQETVDNAALAIIDTFNALVLKDADKSALAQATQITLEYQDDFYTEDTLNAFVDAVNAGNVILANEELTILDQAIVDEATETINTAFAALTLKDADTAELEIAVALAAEYEDAFYTEETITAFNDAVAAGNAILAETLTIADQVEIDALTETINTAFSALTLKGADTAELEIAVALAAEYEDGFYTEETITAFNDAVTAGNTILAETLTIAEQETVDNAVIAITDAINALVLKNADKTALAVATQITLEYQDDFYTEDTLNAFVEAVNAGNELLANEELTILDQAIIDAATDAIDTAFAALTLKDADYTIITDAVAAANEKLAQMQATGNEIIAETITALENAISSVVYGYDITGQNDVNAMAQAITDAAAALKFVPVIEIINPDVVIKDGFFTGMNKVLDEAALISSFNLIGDIALEITPVKFDGVNDGYGTGTLIRVVDSEGTEYESYTVVVYADYNGDGICDVFDQSALTELVNWCEDPATTAQLLAVDICEDGFIDVLDLAFLIEIVNKLRDSNYIDDLAALLDASPIYESDKYIESYYNSYLERVNRLNVLLGSELTTVDDQRVLDFIASFNATLQALETDGLIVADYTVVDDAIGNANALNSEFYDNWNLVEDAINAVVRDLKFTQQDDVNLMAEEINNAVDALVYKASIFRVSQLKEINIDTEASTYDMVANTMQLISTSDTYVRIYKLALNEAGIEIDVSKYPFITELAGFYQIDKSKINFNDCGVVQFDIYVPAEDRTIATELVFPTNGELSTDVLSFTNSTITADGNVLTATIVEGKTFMVLYKALLNGSETLTVTSSATIEDRGDSYIIRRSAIGSDTTVTISGVTYTLIIA